MVRVLMIVLFLSAALQGNKDLIVGRIFVNSSLNNGVVFEYAFASVPEGEPLKEGAIACLVSSLKSTGLFTDVEVKLEQREGQGIADITITPSWTPQVEEFVISSVMLKGFKDIDERELARRIQLEGLRSGVPLLGNPPSRITSIVRDAIDAIAERDPHLANQPDQTVSCTIELVAAGAVRVIVTPTRKYPCQ